MKTVALSLSLLAFAGCSGSNDARPGVDRVCEPGVAAMPCGRGVEQGVAYEFELLTHCGIEWAYLDGRYWVPSPKVDPPSDWAGIERGTITLATGDRAEFVADKGGDATFRPAPQGYTPPSCA